MEFTAVLLAGGEGRRAGGFKPLFLLHNSTVVEHVMMNALTVCAGVRIVGGAQFEQLSGHLKNRDTRVTLIHNQQWQEGGMFSSVQAGLKGLDGPVFIHPVDCFGSGSEVYHALVAAFSGKSAVFRPLYQGKTGHPILLSEDAVNLVRQAPAKNNLAQILSPLQKTDVAIENELVLLDFNTREEFDFLKQKIKTR